MFQKKNVENIFVNVFDGVNKFMDKLRKMILLHEVPSLIRVIYNLILRLLLDYSLLLPLDQVIQL
jgi:hypothetical protein